MSRAKGEFENIPILNTIHNKLPFDEFEKGDFSNAEQINIVFLKTIQELFDTFTRNKLNHTTINEYINTEKQRVSVIQKGIQDQEEKIVKIEQDIKAKLKLLQQDDMLLSQKNWKTLFDFLKKNKKGDIRKFKGALEDLFASNAEEKRKGEEDYQKFIAYPCVVEIQGLQDQVIEITNTLKKEKKDMLYGSIEKYEKSLKIGNVHESIKEEIRKDIYKFFGENGIYQDTRNLKSLFMEKLQNELILSKQSDRTLKKNLIKNHGNKLELFFYIFEDLFMKSDIGRTRFVYNTEANILNIQDERKGKIEELFEYIQQRYEEYTSHMILRDKGKDGFEDTIKFLKQQIQSPKQFSITGYSIENKEIKQARNKLDHILEESEVRYEYERLRNFNYLQLAQRKEDIKRTLEWLFISMTAKEQADIKSQYNDYYIMQEFFKQCYTKYPQEDTQTAIRSSQELEELNPEPVVEISTKKSRKK